MHAPCPAGRRHPCPGLSVALACSPVECLGPAAHLQNRDRHLSWVNVCGECAACCRVLETVNPGTKTFNSQIPSPSSQFTAVVSNEFWQTSDFIILALSRAPAVIARMGDGDRVGTRAKTASVLKPYSLFLDAKTQHDFFFF